MFQPAWRIQNGKLSIDMPAARELWRQELRNARAPMLQAMDQKKIQALHSGQDIDTTAERQRLLDITKDPRIEEAQTIDELMLVWPLNESAPTQKQAPPPIPAPAPEAPEIEIAPEPIAMDGPAPPPPPSWSIQDLMAAAEQEPEQQPLPLTPEAPPPPLPVPPQAAAADQKDPVFLGKMHIPPAPLIKSQEPPHEDDPLPAPTIAERIEAAAFPQSWRSDKLPEMPVVDVTDAERRKAAELAILKSLSGLTIITPEQSIRYEVALQARNGSVPHKMMLEEEASEAGVSIDTFCDRIIMERTLQEQRIMRAYAIRARTLRTILDMEGQAIDDAAAVAAQEIREV